MTPQIRYFDLQEEKRIKAELEAKAKRPAARHFDFFLDRKPEEKVIEAPPPRKILTRQEVAKATQTVLTGKSGVYHHQLTTARPDLMFRRENQCKIIEALPHLGYAAITSGTVPDKEENNVPWMLYFANFNAKFGQGDVLFEDIPKNYGVTFFALALELNEEGIVTGRDLNLRGNGILFATKDPNEAFQNIVKLRETQKMWQMETRRREQEALTLKGMASPPRTRMGIDLPKVSVPGPDDHRNLRATV